MRSGRVIRAKWITEVEVLARLDRTYVFGDNMRRYGSAGQAHAMRGKPNVIGVPTKHSPGMEDSDFFSDLDWGRRTGATVVRHRIEAAFGVLESILAAGHDVVIPAAGIGTGLAQLPTRAPLIHAAIEQRVADLEQRYGRIDE